MKNKSHTIAKIPWRRFGGFVFLNPWVVDDKEREGAKSETRLEIGVKWHGNKSCQ